MSKNKQVKGKKEKVNVATSTLFPIAFLLFTFYFLTGCGVRFDMQDQPRYKAYKKSDFFADGRASRNLPEGTVARGFLKDDKAFHTDNSDNRI